MTTLGIAVMGIDLRGTYADVAKDAGADLHVLDHAVREVRNGNFVYHGEHGENPTGDRAWRYLAALETDWSIVLQDDAIVVPEFRKHAAAALSHAPQTAVSFYVGTGRPRPLQVEHAIRVADAMGACWLECETLLWGVAVAMPTRLITEFLGWTGTDADGTDAKYDARIGKFFERQGIPVRYTWPSLVDHADGYSFVQIPRPVRVTRVAHRVGIAEAWDGPVVKIPQRGALLRPVSLSE